MFLNSPDLWSEAVFGWIIPAVMLDTLFPPVPAEILIITAGTLAAENKGWLWLAITLGALGSFAGEMALFLLFRRRLGHLMDRWSFTERLHRKVRNAVEKSGRAPAYSALVGARFIPGGRLITTAAAGIASLDLRTFASCSALGSLLWASWLAGLGYLTAHTTRWPFWASSLLGTALGLLVGALAGAFIAARRRRQSGSEEEATAPPS